MTEYDFLHQFTTLLSFIYYFSSFHLLLFYIQLNLISISTIFIPNFSLLFDICLTELI